MRNCPVVSYLTECAQNHSLAFLSIKLGKCSGGWEQQMLTHKVLRKSSCGFKRHKVARRRVTRLPEPTQQNSQA